MVIFHSYVSLPEGISTLANHSEFDEFKTALSSWSRLAASPRAFQCSIAGHTLVLPASQHPTWRFVWVCLKTRWNTGKPQESQDLIVEIFSSSAVFNEFNGPGDQRQHSPVSPATARSAQWSSCPWLHLRYGHLRGGKWGVKPLDLGVPSEKPNSPRIWKSSLIITTGHQVG